MYETASSLFVSSGSPVVELAERLSLSALPQLVRLPERGPTRLRLRQQIALRGAGSVLLVPLASTVRDDRMMFAINRLVSSGGFAGMRADP